MDLAKGKIIAEHYQLIKQLGSGSFGNVWLAHNLLADVDVAIKFYGMLDRNGLEEFRKEFKTAYSLRHPNLLNINHFDIFDNCPYLVLPYCEKGDVGHQIGKMDESEIWIFITDVSNGLSFLHSHHPPIIHQDIKPENILITADGHYVITDFGISHKLRTQLTKHSRTGNNYGTLAYMGPERFSAKPMVIIASDIWSFGATLYEIMEGKLLWDGIGGVVQRNHTELPAIENKYSAELNNLVKVCLNENPWERPMASTIYDYAVAYRQHRPLPHLLPNIKTNNINVSPVNTTSCNIVDRTGRINNTISEDKVSVYSGRNVYPIREEKVTHHTSLHTQKNNPLVRWFSMVIALLFFIALLSGSYIFLSHIIEEKNFISCDTLHDFEQFVKKYPHSSYADKARKRIQELTPDNKDEVKEAISTTIEPNIHTVIIENSNRTSKSKPHNNIDETINPAIPQVNSIPEQPQTEDVHSNEELAYYKCYTLEDYLEYKRNYPRGKYINEVNLKIDQLAKIRRQELEQSGTYTNYIPYNYSRNQRVYNRPSSTTSRSFGVSISVSPEFGRRYNNLGGGYNRGPGGGYRGGPGGYHRGSGVRQ